MRVPPSARISLRLPQGSSFGRSIPLDDALSAGSLEAAAQLARLIGVAEGADHGAVVDALGSQIGLADHGLTAAELIWELALQAAERGLRVGFAALRRYLHRVTAGTAIAATRSGLRRCHRRGAGRAHCGGAGWRRSRRRI